MTDVWFLRRALADLRAAYAWYEEQRPGLPYCLYYRSHGDQALIVVACLRVALDPERHQSRLLG